jgi:hypothetical protein
MFVDWAARCRLVTFVECVAGDNLNFWATTVNLNSFTSTNNATIITNKTLTLDSIDTACCLIFWNFPHEMAQEGLSQSYVWFAFCIGSFIRLAKTKTGAEYDQTYDWESPSCAISCGKFQKMRQQAVSILSKVKVLFVMIVALFVLVKLFKLTVVAQKLRLSPATHSTNVTNLHRAAQSTNIASHAVFSQIIRIHWPNLFWVQLYP